MSFAELSAFMNERDDRAEAKAEKAQLKAERHAQELEAKVDKLLEEAAEKQRQEMAGKVEAVEVRVRSEMAAEVRAKVEQERQLAALPALQARLEGLHAAKLLTDNELYKLEDVIADSLEEEAGGGGQVAKLVVLSARVAGDAALARQLRRKFA
jgi:hypothetical protein